MADILSNSDIPCSVSINDSQSQINIPGELNIPQNLLDNNISSSVLIQDSNINTNLNGITNIPGIIKDISGSVALLYDGTSMNFIFGSFNFSGKVLQNNLNGNFMIINQIYNREIEGSISVKSAKFRTDMYSNILVLPISYLDINSTITVSNDGLSDLFCRVVMNSISQNTDLNGNLNLLPFSTTNINGSVNINPIITRREMTSYLNVVGGVNSDLDSYVGVVNEYIDLDQDIPSSIIVGSLLSQDILNATLNVMKANFASNDLLSTITVSNGLYPLRVGIVVDPLWNYSSPVYRACLITFLDRIYSKGSLTIISGGNPNSDYDMVHFSKVFGVKKVVLCPIIYDPSMANGSNKSIEDYLTNLTKFDIGENPVVDKVIIFRDSPMEGWSVTNPIVDYCKTARIPCVCINSDGRPTYMKTVTDTDEFNVLLYDGSGSY